MKLQHAAPIRNADDFDIKFQVVDGEQIGNFVMMCPNRNSQCSIGIKKGDPDGSRCLHGWDGNLDEPTITPSIGCEIAPRCGWHGHVIKGIRTP